jgi:hypothetical protein
VSLSDWVKAGWAVEHKTSPQEISHLFKIVDRDLADCRILDLSLDRRFMTAYHAALGCATIALLASGFRLTSGDHHVRTIASLEYSLCWDRMLIVKLDAFRKKRNIGDYHIAGIITEVEMDEMVVLANKLKEDVMSWLATNLPELLA